MPPPTRLPVRHGRIALPAELVQRRQLPAGTPVRIVSRDDGVIELHPEPPRERPERVRTADADIAAGRLARFDDVEALLAELDT